MERSELAIIIPAFNEEQTIAGVVRDVSSYGVPIVVNDASKDRTVELAEAAGAVVVMHNQNYGYDEALNSGFKKADELGCKYAITFDGDGQHEPSIINKYKEHLLKYDLVLGYRPQKARISEVIIGIYFLMRLGIRDILCGMKGYNLQLYRRNGRFDHIKSIGSELAFISVKSKCSFIQIPVPVHMRKDNPRFGNIIKSNTRIIKALFRVIQLDVKNRHMT
jgi:glycosyltransferase involved in cell wall biosynthesis